MKILKIAFPLFGLLLLSVIFWYGVIPGIVLGAIFRGRCERLVTLVSSAGIFILANFTPWISIPIFNVFVGTGAIAVVGGFALGWLWCAFLFFAGYRVERYFRAGYQSAQQTERTSEG